MNPKDRPPACLSKLQHGRRLHGAEARDLARYVLRLGDRAPKVKIATYHRRWLFRVIYGAPALEVLPAEQSLAAARKRIIALERLDKEREQAKQIKDTPSRRAALQRLDAQAERLFPQRKVYPLSYKRFMSILWYVQAGKTKAAQRKQATLTWTLGGGLRRPD
jgi:hypothetical protein